MPRISRRSFAQTTLAAGGAALAAPRRSAAPERAAAVPAGRERLLFDRDWRFALGHASDPAKDFGYGARNDWGKTGEFLDPALPEYDASAWRALDLPHDWAVKLPFVEAEELKDHGYKPLGRNFPATSIGWYRRVFTLPESDRGRRLVLDFDGVYRDCIVALNGQYLGRNLSGYAPFRFDITDMVSFGRPNALVVRADATQREGWFYEGAGIYRHVWLTRCHPLHIPAGSTFVRADVHGLEPEAQAQGARRQGAGTTIAAITVGSEIANDSDDPLPCHVTAEVVAPSGRTVATARSAIETVPAWERRPVTLRLNVPRPELWSVEAPRLYRLVLTVHLGGTRGGTVNGASVSGASGGTVDREETPFGIRTMRFDADRGFFLNGRRVELKGTCNHQDHAGVGAAVPDALQGWRVRRLQAFGVNAYRTSHNPPTPELLDACDALGMLVLDENRLFEPDEEGLGQLERMVRRDRNHPCIFAWSLANEEWRVQGDERGARIAAPLKRLVRRLDPTRPVTCAMNGGWGSPLTELMDVQGFNYGNRREPANDEDAMRRRFPAKPMMGTEVASTVSTRGIYVTDAARGYLSAYDVNTPPWGATAEGWWTRYAARPWLAGGFVWTGFDYRGEPTPYGWPCVNSHFGILDTCGFPKDVAYYYKAWWGTEPVLHLFPHWNWGTAGPVGRGTGGPVEVWCFTNLDRVELVLNGRSLGAKDVPRNGHVAWTVPFEPGTLEARGFRGTQLELTAVRRTSGPAARLALVADAHPLRADGEDACVVTAEVRDADERKVPTAGDAVTFRVTGAARLIGVGNGDPSCHESDKGETRSAFGGSCCAILQAGREAGEARVEASAPGLQGATLVLPVAAGTPRPGVPS